MFSLGSRQLHVFASSFDWFIVLPVSFVIGWNVYFCFGFILLIENRSNREQQQAS